MIVIFAFLQAVYLHYLRTMDSQHNEQPQSHQDATRAHHDAIQVLRNNLAPKNRAYSPSRPVDDEFSDDSTDTVIHRPRTEPPSTESTEPQPSTSTQRDGSLTPLRALLALQNPSNIPRVLKDVREALMTTSPPAERKFTPTPTSSGATCAASSPSTYSHGMDGDQSTHTLLQGSGCTSHYTPPTQSGPHDFWPANYGAMSHPPPYLPRPPCPVTPAPQPTEHFYHTNPPVSTPAAVPVATFVPDPNMPPTSTIRPVTSSGAPVTVSDAAYLLIGEPSRHTTPTHERHLPEFIAHAYQQIQALLQLHLCMVCQIYKRDTVIQPCHHLVMCNRCAVARGAHCPLLTCRHPIARRVRVNNSPYSRHVVPGHCS